MPHYVYVLVRTDLPGAQVSVQACHAAVAGQRAFGAPEAPHPILVLCGVPSERELELAFERLKQQGVPCCSWREEDMADEMTAVATGPLCGSPARWPMKRFRLLGRA